MAAKLVLAPEAELDVSEGYAWYEKQRPGLGEEFLSCLDARMEAICRSPEAHALLRKDYRRALVRRFPYAIFYKYANDCVTVYCIFHTSRNPAKWRRRLP